MDDELFHHYVVRAIESLPAAIRKKMDNVAVVVEDTPDDEQLLGSGVRRGSLLLGLYQGVPRTKRGSAYGVGGTLPDKITIFKHSILMVASTHEEIVEQVRSTVLHEIAHHFGMDEDAVRRAERKRY